MPKKQVALTPTESALLRFVAEHVVEFGYQPSYRDIASAWGYASVGYILTLVTKLKAKGVVQTAGPRAIAFDYKAFIK